MQASKLSTNYDSGFKMSRSFQPRDKHDKSNDNFVFNQQFLNSRGSIALLATI
jgi:hypothetical protein